MTEKNPEVVYFPAVLRRICPICGKAAYSLSGEHPQCAMSRTDLAAKARQKKRNDIRRAALSHNVPVAE